MRYDYCMTTAVPQGKALLYDYCARLGVPYKRIGKLIVATNITYVWQCIPTPASQYPPGPSRSPVTCCACMRGVHATILPPA